MADYIPTDWECGEVLTDELLNHIEQGVADINGNYVPTTWTVGDVVTADRLNKIEQGIANADIGSGCCDSLSGLIDRTISAVSNKRVTQLVDSAFQCCSLLTTANFRNVSLIGASVFESCSALTSISFPNATYISGYAFEGCSALTSVDFPNVEVIENNAFYHCIGLTEIRFPSVSKIWNEVFQGCSLLTTAIFLTSSVPELGNYNAFYYTPMSNSTYTGSFGSIYVPASLVDAYKNATNWSRYADRITAYTE